MLCLSRLSFGICCLFLMGYSWILCPCWWQRKQSPLQWCFFCSWIESLSIFMTFEFLVGVTVVVVYLEKWIFLWLLLVWLWFFSQITFVIALFLLRVLNFQFRKLISLAWRWAKIHIKNFIEIFPHLPTITNLSNFTCLIHRTWLLQQNYKNLNKQFCSP